jgi:hypothetical protein
MFEAKAILWLNFINPDNLVNLRPINFLYFVFLPAVPVAGSFFRAFVIILFTVHRSLLTVGLLAFSTLRQFDFFSFDITPQSYFNTFDHLDLPSK